ncbi:MAG: BREX system ATP-binding domain-containing protein [Armatimonadota bacterium]
MADISRVLQQLRQGEPPDDPEYLRDMTVGRELWLDRFCEHYLESFIRQGGSKVKVLVGGAGCGKTHLLRCVEADAKARGYVVVFLDLEDVSWRLSNIVELYKAVAACVNREELVRGLCRRVARELGYGTEEEYDGSGSILPLLVEREGLLKTKAHRELRQAISKVVGNDDLSMPFRTLAFTLLQMRMAGQSANDVDACWRWLAGEQLDAAEQKRTYLYERLTRSNGRVWLYSLIRLLRLSGKAGVIVIMDNVGAMLKRNPETGRFLYTPNAIKDTCELIRQLIDDIELLRHFMLILSGRRELITDERRGFRSYEALWMRLQSGLAQTMHFNPWADIVDVDNHYKALGGDALGSDVAKRLKQWLEDKGYPLRYNDSATASNGSSLRGAIKEIASMAEPD